MQFAPDARPASSAVSCVHGTNTHQQRLSAQVTTPGDFSSERTNKKTIMVASHTYTQHPTLHADRPHTPTSNPGARTSLRLGKVRHSFFQNVALHRDPCQIGSQTADLICSAVTFDRLSAPFSVPSRCALTQLNNVCSTRPNVRDAAAILWPDSTSRTASCLNSSVYRARVALIIVISFADCQLWDTFGGAGSYLSLTSINFLRRCDPSRQFKRTPRSAVICMFY